MLRQLEAAGWDVRILGATVFDADAGTAGLTGQWPAIAAQRGSLVTIVDGALEHRLLVTASTRREAMTNGEEGSWFGLYVQALDEFAPDVVFYYGGQPFDYLIASEARQRGAKVAFLLVNGNYHDTRWRRDVDLILTDSAATAALYRERLSLEVTPVGTFIDPPAVVSAAHTRERVLFVNPVPGKGALLVVALAVWLQRHRPQITLEIVEGRGKWADLLARVALPGGAAIPDLPNVVVTAATADMRPVYGRARIVLAPSLWWESGSRVLGEAMLNGIPAIVTDRGGSPEMVGQGGVVLGLPERFYQAPYTALPDETETARLGEIVTAQFDSAAAYDELVRAAVEVGRQVHGLTRNVRHLTRALTAILSGTATG
jgi:glycosyltransferase involved in cell wall biosynthesis